MTGYEKLKTLLEDFGLSVQTRENVKSGYNLQEHDILIDSYGSAYKKNERHEGYSEFVCIFSFDENGNFIKVGIWE